MAETIVQNLFNHFIRPDVLIFELSDQVEALKEEFSRTQCLLKVADADHEEDERVKKWVRDATDAAFGVEDFIDTFVFNREALRPSGIRRYAFIFNQLIARGIFPLNCWVNHAIGLEIKRTKNKVRAISESRSTYGIQNISQEEGSSSAGLSLQEWRLNSPRLEEPDLVGSELSSSYKNLPHHLKPCFLYLGIFPADYEFRAKKLIQLWAAEGLLQPRGDETLEKMGEDCLNELIKRSMIQLVKTSSSGGIKSCCINSLSWQLSISEAKEYNFLQVHHENVHRVHTSTARRLAIHCNDSSEIINSLNYSTPLLRSVLIHTQLNQSPERKHDEFPPERKHDESPPPPERKHDEFPRGFFKSMRVLDLHGVAIKELPSEIGALIHLIYLSCTETWLKSLPSSIGNLQQLQTLVVTSHDYVIHIPSEMEKMKKLRHFQVKSAREDISYHVFRGKIDGHRGLDGFSNLQTLTCVEAGEWMKDCLGKLTNLRKLGICLDLGGLYDEVLSESILKLVCLQSLSVVQYQYPPRDLKLSVPFTSFLQLKKLRLEGKLEELPKFPANLTQLTLVYSYLEKDPLPKLKQLKNLRILRLLWLSYSGEQLDFKSQGFCKLETLHLEGLRKLEKCTVTDSALPKLLNLRIDYCQRLKKLPKGINFLKDLKKLELWHMPSSFKIRLQEDGADWKKIHRIPYIHIK